VGGEHHGDEEREGHEKIGTGAIQPGGNTRERRRHITWTQYPGKTSLTDGTGRGHRDLQQPQHNTSDQHGQFGSHDASPDSVVAW